MGVKLQSALGGSVELNAPSTASNFSMTVPAGNGTVATTDQLQNFRNKIINGSMVIAQRATTAAAIADNTYNTVDRWISEHAATAVTLNDAQVADAPPGFKFSRKMTSASTATLAASQYLIPFEQRIEGFNLIDLGFGTGSPSSLTLSFWIKSNKTGTRVVEINGNGAGGKHFPKQYTINQADTWEYKTITVPGDSTQTLLSDNQSAMTIFFWMAVGSNYSSGTLPTTWQTQVLANRAVGCPSTVTNGDYWQITGVQLEKGTVATPFEHRPYSTELALCQRYFYDLNSSAHAIPAYWGVGAPYTTNAWQYIQFGLPVSMRVTPSPSITTSSLVNLNTVAAYGRASNRVEIQARGSAAAVDSYFYTSSFTVNAEL